MDVEDGKGQPPQADQVDGAQVSESKRRQGRAGPHISDKESNQAASVHCKAGPAAVAGLELRAVPGVGWHDSVPAGGAASGAAARSFAGQLVCGDAGPRPVVGKLGHDADADGQAVLLSSYPGRNFRFGHGGSSNGLDGPLGREIGGEGCVSAARPAQAPYTSASFQGGFCGAYRGGGRSDLAERVWPCAGANLTPWRPLYWGHDGGGGWGRADSETAPRRRDSDMEAGQGARALGAGGVGTGQDPLSCSTPGESSEIPAGIGRAASAAAAAAAAATAAAAFKLPVPCDSEALDRPTSGRRPPPLIHASAFAPPPPAAWSPEASGSLQRAGRAAGEPARGYCAPGVAAAAAADVARCEARVWERGTAAAGCGSAGWYGTSELQKEAVSGGAGAGAGVCAAGAEPDDPFHDDWAYWTKPPG